MEKGAFWDELGSAKTAFLRGRYSKFMVFGFSEKHTQNGEHVVQMASKNEKIEPKTEPTSMQYPCKNKFGIRIQFFDSGWGSGTPKEAQKAPKREVDFPARPPSACLMAD